MAYNQSEQVFHPRDITNNKLTFAQPTELWLSMLECPCSFSSEIFTRVMLNLIRNPNINSSHLFRADIFYDSLNDVSFTSDPTSQSLSSFIKHMKREYRPIRATLPGWVLERTIVRQMVPRNPQLDRHLVQTCHFFRAEATENEMEEVVILQIPHASAPENIPWYHPAVRSLAFLYSRQHVPNEQAETLSNATISVHYSLFPNTSIDNRLTRTALNLLRTIHKHGQGQQAGYKKRVNHDLVIPQARFQNRYTTLKVKYAKRLIGEWSEQTDPTKHVFEDLGIAAFLIELWNNMYGLRKATENDVQYEGFRDGDSDFPGFVDIGCGNGVLVYVLLQEGYQGWGFDARRRKTWDTFSAGVQKHLKEILLVPRIFSRASATESGDTDPTQHDDQRDEIAGLTTSINQLRLANGLNSENIKKCRISPTQNPVFHNGRFPGGTFIISNHADELTAWTPLLAYLSDSPFIAIPCCSHNLAGARFRAPAPPDRIGTAKRPPRASEADRAAETSTGATQRGMSEENTDKSGSIAKPAGFKQPSAYASLCAYVERLAEEVGYTTEREMLRIPSTRNAAIIGRPSSLIGSNSFVENDGKVGVSARQHDKEEKVCEMVKRELGMSVEMVGEEWIDRATKLASSKGKSH